MNNNEGTFEAMDEVVAGFYAAADRFVDNVKGADETATRKQARSRTTMLRPEGNSWKLCLIGGCAIRDGRCFNCGATAATEE